MSNGLIDFPKLQQFSAYIVMQARIVRAETQGLVQLAAGWSRRDASRRVLSVTAGVGLTPTAPAVTLGAGWQWGLR